MTGYSREEQETTVSVTRADEFVHIWTAIPAHINRLKKNTSFTLLRESTTKGEIWASFSIPATNWNPASGAKRKRNLSEEQKAESAARLKKARESRGN